MRIVILYTWSILASSLPERAVAQTASPSALHVKVVDAGTGRPLLRTWYHHWGRGAAGNVRYLGFSRGDTTEGVLAFDRTSGSRVEVFCQRSDGLYGGRRVALLDSVRLAQVSPEDTLRLAIDARGCDRRPLTGEQGVWLGHYVDGFEVSDFRWCGDTARSIWVRYAPGDSGKARAAWPSDGARGDPPYFVGFRGTLVGPFAYGHFATSDYELTVDSILFARSATGEDCIRQF